MVGGVEELRCDQPLSYGIGKRNTMLVGDVGRHHITAARVASPKFPCQRVVETVALGIGVPYRTPWSNIEFSVAMVSRMVVLQLIVGARHHTQASRSQPLVLRDRFLEIADMPLHVRQLFLAMKEGLFQGLEVPGEVAVFVLPLM